MRTFEWAIEDIVAVHPSLSLSEFAAMAVFLMEPFGNPCSFLVEIAGFAMDALDGENEFTMNVIWDSATASSAARIARTKQRIPIVEGAAVALSTLLLSHFLANSEIEVTMRHQRADYVLTKLHRAVEISGTEHQRELPRRSRMKAKQMLENAFGFDGYVIICCFEETGRLIRWSYHTQME